MTVCCWLRRASRALMSLSYLNLPKSMSLHTGGRAMGATSTRSRSTSPASCRARSRGTMPTCSPSGPTSRTSRARICSLTRGSTLMGPPQVSSRVRDLPQAEGPGRCQGPLDRSPPTVEQHRDGYLSSRTVDRTRQLRGLRVGAGAPLETLRRVQDTAQSVDRQTVTRRLRRAHATLPAEILDDLTSPGGTSVQDLLMLGPGRGEERAQPPHRGHRMGPIRRLYRHDRDHVVVP